LLRESKAHQPILVARFDWLLQRYNDWYLTDFKGTCDVVELL